MILKILKIFIFLAPQFFPGSSILFENSLICSCQNEIINILSFFTPKCHNPSGLSRGSVVRCCHSGPCGAAEDVEKSEDAERDAGGQGGRGPRGLGPVFGGEKWALSTQGNVHKTLGWKKRAVVLVGIVRWISNAQYDADKTPESHILLVLRMRRRLRQFWTSVWIRDLDAGAQGRVKRPKPVTVMTEGALRESTGGREGGTDMVPPPGPRTPPIPNRPSALSLQQWFLPSVTRSLIPPIVYMV